MPWKETCQMKEKERFIELCLSKKHTMSDCCRMSGISRQTGHKMWRRFKAEGMAGLAPHSRAPMRQANAIESTLAQQLIEVRIAHPGWGPRKVVAHLRNTHPEMELPAPSTVGELFKREGLIRAKKRRARPARYNTELGGYHGPNAVWCADFKGQFACGNKKLCYPLTISDGYSRALLRCHALSSTKTRASKRVFEATFKEFGLPDAIRTDNGSPFSSVAGISRLSLWWILLGIAPLRITPGKPTQNGRHERIHRTMVDELLRFGVEKNMRGQQRAFDVFTNDYNHKRPHEALANKTPASVYVPSVKRYPTKLREPQYADTTLVYRLNKHGELLRKGRRYPICSLLANYPVGITVANDGADEGIEKLFFGPLQLAHFHPKRGFKRGVHKKPFQPMLQSELNH